MTRTYRCPLAGLLLTTALLPASGAIAQEEGDGAFLGTIRIGSLEAQEILGNETVTAEEIENTNPASVADVV